MKKPNELLRYHRKQKGWSQVRLAELIGADPTLVSRWELGIQAPSPYYREKLIELFGKTAEELDFLNSSLPKPLQKAIQEIESRPPSLPSQTELYQAITRYLYQQRIQMLGALIPGSTNLRVADIVGIKGLFIPPLWEMLQNTAISADLIEYLIAALISGERILLLGDAGQGKTIILKQVFNLLVDRFLSEPGNSPIPLYIPLREIFSLVGNAIELLWQHVKDELSISLRDFAFLVQKRQIIFLFDGFDEVKGELTQRSLNERAASKVFSQVSILTCRKSFFEFYLSMSSLRQCYPQWIELQPLVLSESVSTYITAFYQHKQNRGAHRSNASPENILKMIQDSQELQDLARRPLLLVMMLDIFTDPRAIKEDEWNVTKLYGKYTEKWLKNEAAKPGSLLKWNEKTQLLQEIAWRTYTAKGSTSSPYRLSQSETFTQNQLTSILRDMECQYYPDSEAQILDELCFRTMLAVSEADNYYFLHKTFHEYYVAKYIYERMHIKSQSIDTVTEISNILQEVLPFEVVNFLKEMLKSKGTGAGQIERDFIVNNLIAVYRASEGDTIQQITIRQHASHYLTRLGTYCAVQFLEQAYDQEPNKWVQRGIMVGLALYCDKLDILEGYIKMVRDDPEVASINLGYHLIYYGDQAPECGYSDQRGELCDGTLRSLFRHLNTERHKNSWPLDLLTLSALLETRGVTILASHKQGLPFLLEFLEREHQGQSDVFRREKEHLAKIVQGVAV